MDVYVNAGFSAEVQQSLDVALRETQVPVHRKEGERLFKAVLGDKSHQTIIILSLSSPIAASGEGNREHEEVRLPFWMVVCNSWNVQFCYSCWTFITDSPFGTLGLLRVQM